MRMELLRNRKAQGLAEYAVILVGVTVVSLGALSVLGHNIGDLLATSAAILPSSQPEWDQQVYVGELIELNVPGAFPNAVGINLAIDEIDGNISAGTNRLAENVTNGQFSTNWANLVYERTP